MDCKSDASESSKSIKILMGKVGERESIFSVYIPSFEYSSTATATDVVVVVVVVVAAWRIFFSVGNLIRRWELPYSSILYTYEKSKNKEKRKKGRKPTQAHGRDEETRGERVEKRSKRKLHVCQEIKEEEIKKKKKKKKKKTLVG